MSDIDIAIWTHRPGPWIKRAMTSVARHCHFSFNLVVVCEPGTVPENMQRVLNRAKGRFLFWMEDDVEILASHTIPHMRQVLVDNKDVAVVSPLIVSDQEEADEYTASYTDGAKFEPKPEKQQRQIQIPLTAMFDREKLPDLYIEHGYIHHKYFYDSDLLLQAWANGFFCMLDFNVRIFHNQRPSDGSEETKEWFDTRKQFCGKWDMPFQYNHQTIPGNQSPEPIRLRDDLP